MATCVPATCSILCLPLVVSVDVSYIDLFVLLLSTVFTYLKYCTYSKGKKLFKKSGWCPHWAYTCKNAWCERRTIIQAASDCGYKQKAKDFFYKLGYRWWDFIPFMKSGN